MDPAAAVGEFKQIVRRFQPVETQARESMTIDAAAFSGFRGEFGGLIPRLSGEALAIALVMRALCTFYIRLANPDRAELELLEELAGAEPASDLAEARADAARGLALIEELGMDAHREWAKDVCSRLGVSS